MQLRGKVALDDGSLEDREASVLYSVQAPRGDPAGKQEARRRSREQLAILGMDPSAHRRYNTKRSLQARTRRSANNLQKHMAVQQELVAELLANVSINLGME